MFPGLFIANEDGQLKGIVTIDDVLELPVDELNEPAKIMAREQFNEFRMRR